MILSKNLSKWRCCSVRYRNWPEGVQFNNLWDEAIRKATIAVNENSYLEFIRHGARELASFNTDQSAWIADAGQYQVKIGSSSEDIKLTRPFTLAKTLAVEKVNKALSPPTAIAELKSKNQK